VLLHAQLTAGVATALEAWAARARVVSVVFAHAPDGTPHALTEIDTAAAAGQRRAAVPLSAACAHLSRTIVEAVAGEPRLDDAATVVPAPWLELRTSERFDGGRRRIEARFGGVAVGTEDVALLERLDGRAMAELALTAEERERVRELAERGLVVVR
jgi:hypothetical protein